jgi:hypothetical protein
LVALIDCDVVNEYLTSEQETVDQLNEFEASLLKMSSGNVSLVDHLDSVQLAIQSAVRNTTSSEVLNLFLKKENVALRSRLASLESDLKLGRIPVDSFNSQVVEIIQMLEKLKEPLLPTERDLLQKVCIYLIAII